MDLLLILIILALGGTLLALMLGLFVMGGSSATDRMVSTKLMWARVGLQSVTFVLLIAAVAVQSG